MTRLHAGPLGITRTRVGQALLLAGLVFFALGPFVLDARQMQLAIEFMTLLVLALMWNLLAGYADIVTIGQHAFVGIGAYAFYGLLVLRGWGPGASLALAGVTALLFAVPIMAVIFRLRAAYLSVGSWVLAETLMLGAGKLKAFGGGSGVSMPVAAVKQFGSGVVERFTVIYGLAFALCLAAFVATWLLMRSGVGLGLMAMRDNEQGAGSVGVNLTRARVLLFLWTAPFLGLAGALITLQKLRVAPPASFSITDWTVYIIFIVVIGGIGSFEGPIIGTVVFFVIRETLGGAGVWNFIVLGGVSIAVILIEPRGLWGMLRRFMPADLIPVSRAAKQRGHVE
jgi:branched-chain amino acid transport system permease protein